MQRRTFTSITKYCENTVDRPRFSFVFHVLQYTWHICVIWKKEGFFILIESNKPLYGLLEYLLQGAKYKKPQIYKDSIVIQYRVGVLHKEEYEYLVGTAYIIRHWTVTNCLYFSNHETSKKLFWNNLNYRLTCKNPNMFIWDLFIKASILVTHNSL